MAESKGFKPVPKNGKPTRVPRKRNVMTTLRDRELAEFERLRKSVGVSYSELLRQMVSHCLEESTA